MSDMVSLGELVDIKGGGTPSRAVQKYWGGPIPWATVKDFKSTVLDATQETITPTGVAESATNIIPAGTVIVPTRMAVGKAAINTVDLAINQDLKALLPKGGVAPRFLLHFLLSKASLLEDQAQGATVKGIKLDLLRSLQFPKISLTEQHRVANILDKAENIRNKREEALMMTDGLLRAAFLHKFGDPLNNPFGFRMEKVEQQLSKARAGTQSGPFGSALKRYEYTDSGIPVWGVDNVQSNQFIDSAKLFISEEKFQQLRRYDVQAGDILISRAGTVGRMCIAQPRVDKSIISTNLIRVVLNTKALLPEYFVSLFTYMSHRLGALKANNKDNAFTFLNPRTLRSLEIPIPPIQLQEEYRLLTQVVNSQIALAQRQLGEARDLVATLSQRAFSGKL